MEKSTYIEVGMVVNKPGNPVIQTSIQTKAILYISTGEDEMIKIGAAATICFITGMAIYTVETRQELLEKIAAAERKAVL